MISSWVHRFFWCQKREGIFRCQFQFKEANLWLPRTFTWTLGKDEDSLRGYIDALSNNNKSITGLWESKGAAVDHTYAPASDAPVVRLDPVKLMAILRGEYVLEIPCTSRIVLADPERAGTKFMPQEIEAALVADEGPLHEAYVQRLQELAQTKQPLLSVLDKAAFSGKTKASRALWNPRGNVTGSLALSPAVEEQPIKAPAGKDVEIEVGRIDHETHVEVNYTCGKYFVRRLFRDNEPFFAASSYDAKTWEIFYINQPLYDTIFQPEMSV